jgi:hypothetical protein
MQARLHGEHGVGRGSRRAHGWFLARRLLGTGTIWHALPVSWGSRVRGGECDVWEAAWQEKANSLIASRILGLYQSKIIARCEILRSEAVADLTYPSGANSQKYLIIIIIP